MVDKLDLGNTRFNDGEKALPGWAKIDLHNGKRDEGGVRGNWDNMPFPDNTFWYAFGTCYLEEADGTSYKELFRVLKPGGIAVLGACSSFYCCRYSPFDGYDQETFKPIVKKGGWAVIPKGESEPYSMYPQRPETYSRALSRWFEATTHDVKAFEAAGFKVVRMNMEHADGDEDVPLARYTIRKPKEA